MRAIRVRLDVTHRHDDASVVGLLTQLRVHLHELVLVDVLQP